MPKAYSYVRWSTPEQARGGTLERQLKLSREYAAKHNLELDESYVDPGVSAYRGKNRFEGALANFIAHVRSGQIPQGSYLLVESLDRLSRDKVLRALSLFISIIEAGITIVSLLDEQVYSAEDMERTPGMIMMSIGVMMRANDESKVKSRRKQEDVEKKLREAREHQTPITAQCPSWLRLVKLGNGKREYEIIPHHVTIVRRIYLDAVAGLGAVQIVTRLEDGRYSEDGKPTPAFRGKNGWHPSSVKKILSNLAVLGLHQPHHKIDGKRVAYGEPFELFPQIIEPELFWRARKAIEERRTGAAGRKGKGYANLFTGLGFCECGAKLRYVNKGPPPKGGNYLVCSDSLRRHRCKNRTGFPYNRFETFMLRGSASNVVASDLFREEPDGAAARRVGEIQTALMSKRALRERFIEQFDKDPDDSQIQDRIRWYGTEVQQLEAELVEARKAANQEQYVDQKGWIAQVIEARLKLDSHDPEEVLLARASLAQEFRRVIDRMVLSSDRRVTVRYKANAAGLQQECVYGPDGTEATLLVYPDRSVVRFGPEGLRLLALLGKEFDRYLHEIAIEEFAFGWVPLDEERFKAKHISQLRLNDHFRVVDLGNGIREIVPAEMPA